MSQGVEVSGQAVPSPLRLPIAPAGPPWTRRRRGPIVEDAVDNLSGSGESVKEHLDVAALHLAGVRH